MGYNLWECVRKSPGLACNSTNDRTARLYGNVREPSKASHREQGFQTNNVPSMDSFLEASVCDRPQNDVRVPTGTNAGQFRKPFPQIRMAYVADSRHGNWLNSIREGCKVYACSLSHRRHWIDIRAETSHTEIAFLGPESRAAGNLCGPFLRAKQERGRVDISDGKTCPGANREMSFLFSHSSPVSLFPPVPRFSL